MKKLAIAAAVMAYALIAVRAVCLAQDNATQVSVEPAAGAERLRAAHALKRGGYGARAAHA